MKVHFVSVDGKSACGREIPAEFLTSDPAEVTCGNCLRTAVVKTAAGVEDAVGAVIIDSAEAEADAE